MANIGKKPTDDQMLEGGGGGGGYKSSPKKSYDPDAEVQKLVVGLGTPLAAAGTIAAIGKSPIADTDNEKLAQERREAKNEIKRESRGMAKGGSASSRADGIAQRGKTRGKMY